MNIECRSGKLSRDNSSWTSGTERSVFDDNTFSDWEASETKSLYCFQGIYTREDTHWEARPNYNSDAGLNDGGDNSEEEFPQRERDTAKAYSVIS
jgi:hypothetical protein